MKTLIVYYSLTGNTRLICEALKKNMSADIQRLREQRQYNRISAYVTGLAAALSGSGRAILPLEEDVSAYDRIVIAAPVWAAHLAPPVVTFLRCYDLRNKPVYVLLTHTGETGQIVDIVKEEVTRSEGKLGGITMMQLTPELVEGLQKQNLALWLNTETGTVQVEQMTQNYPNMTKHNRRV